MSAGVKDLKELPWESPWGSWALKVFEVPATEADRALRLFCWVAALLALAGFLRRWGPLRTAGALVVFALTYRWTSGPVEGPWYVWDAGVAWLIVASFELLWVPRAGLVSIEGLLWFVFQMGAWGGLALFVGPLALAAWAGLLGATVAAMVASGKRTITVVSGLYGLFVLLAGAALPMVYLAKTFSNPETLPAVAGDAFKTWGPRLEGVLRQLRSASQGGWNFSRVAVGGWFPFIVAGVWSTIAIVGTIARRRSLEFRWTLHLLSFTAGLAALAAWERVPNPGFDVVRLPLALLATTAPIAWMRTQRRVKDAEK